MSAKECAKKDIKRHNKGQDGFVLLFNSKYESKCINKQIDHKKVIA